MKNRLLHIFFHALAALFCLCSCGLEDPTNTPQNSDGYVEFVARPTKLDKTLVTTKAGDDIENNIYNAFILLFDEHGNRIMKQDVKLLDSYPSISIPADKGLSTITACFLINVPPSFAQDITGLENPNPGVNDNKYINTAVLSNIVYSETVPFGVPLIDHDGDGATEPIACLPMFGMDSFDIHGTTRQCQISVKRLFAKASFNLSMDLSDTGTLGVNRNTYFELLSYQLLNIPRKAVLVEPAQTETSYETNWHGQENAYRAQQVSNTGNTPIYNAEALGNDNHKSYTFEMYLPEYYILPLPSTTENYGDQKYKPEMYDSENKTAICVRLKGTYKPVSGGNIGLEYDLYLGENEATSFTIKRNKHYINNITITGVNNRDLDCRVNITEGGDLTDVYGEVANCYAISSTGNFGFKAYKGAYKYAQYATAPKCSGTTVRIIAQDVDGVTLQHPEDPNNQNPFLVKDDKDVEGLKVISFNVTDISADCNMVIALMNGETVEWTWHLWFIKGLSLGNMGFFELGTQDMPDNKGKMMDMNLGVTRAVTGDWIGGAATGFYYKYGHRAPFFDDKLKGNGKKYHGYKDGEYSPWNVNGKSSTDPCPPGYKVPNSSVWSKTNGTAGTIVDAFIYWNSGTTYIYYPYSGYLGSNNELISEINESTFTKFKADDYKPLGAFSKSFNTDVIDGEPVQETEFNQKRTQTYTENELSAFEYEVFMSLSDIGRVWSANNACLAYNARDNKWALLKITLCKLSTRTVTRTQRRIRTWVPGYIDFSQRPPKWIDGHYSDYGTWENLGGWENGSWSTATTVTEQTQLPVIGTINNEEYRKDLRTHQSLRDFSSMQCSIPTYTNNPTEGYQVRCVKE